MSSVRTFWLSFFLLLLTPFFAFGEIPLASLKTDFSPSYKTTPFFISLISPKPPLYIQNNPFFQGNSPETTPKVKKKQNRFGQWLVNFQRNINRKLASYIQQIREGNKLAFFSALALAFIYGIAHAAGPGHRKVVLFSYFSTHQHPFSHFIIASFATTALHAFAAIFLTVSVFYAVSKAINSKVDNLTKATETVSWLFIVLFGLVMLIVSTINWISKEKKRISKNTDLPAKTTKNIQKQALWILVFFSGIIPCPAASTIMIITLQKKALWLGVSMVIAMSIGMGITVCLAALPGFLSNRGIEKITKDKNFCSWKAHLIEWSLELLSSLFLIIFGLLMALPALC